MNVLIVSAVYPPEPVVSSQTSAGLARYLAERGHRVTVVTNFPNRPAGTLYPGFRRTLFRRDQDGPVTVVRCFSTFSRRSTLASRLAENLSFGLSSAWAVLTGSRPDVIYANTWPIFASGLLALVARARRIPVVGSIQDVYPESLISQQRIGAGSTVARALRWVDREIARGWSRVIVISDNFARLYVGDRGIARERVRVIPNWVSGSHIRPDPAGGREVRRELGIPEDAFVLVYGGNVGAAAGVEGVVEAFVRLGDFPRAHLIVAGEGSSLDSCRSLARACEGRVHFRTLPLAENSRVFGAADVLVLPTRGRQSLASVPSKLIGYMLAGRPVLAAALPESDLARFLDEAGGGWLVPPDEPDALAQRIRDLAALPGEALDRMGKANRRYALESLTEEVCVPRVLAELEGALA